MEGGPPGFRPGFTCQALLGILTELFRISPTRLSRTTVELSSSFGYSSESHQESHNTTQQAGWFWLVPFRSPLLRESRLISFPLGTEMFHFPRYRFLHLCIQCRMTVHNNSRVSPFGNLRITGCLRLPEAYRSLSRPSSPVGAKASIIRP